MKDRRNRHLVLTGMLVGLLLMRPVIPTFITSIIFFTVTVASALILAEDKRKTRTALAILGVPLILGAILERAFPQSTPTCVQGIAGTITAGLVIVFLVYSGSVILLSFLRAGSIAADEIFGIINFYLILGFMWAYIYVLVEDISPNSFRLNLPQDALAPGLGRTDLLISKFIYFSFVTMTTLGYGDIVPHSELAETLVITEAINGQLYVAVAVAYLLSLHLIEFRSTHRGDRDHQWGMAETGESSLRERENQPQRADDTKGKDPG